MLNTLLSHVARSKQVYIEWLEATVLFCRDCLREKEIYIHLVYAPYALLAAPRTPRWRRPVRPVGDAPYAPLATPRTPR
jgi:hypothetical protein